MPKMKKKHISSTPYNYCFHRAQWEMVKKAKRRKGINLSMTQKNNNKSRVWHKTEESKISKQHKIQNPKCTIHHAHTSDSLSILAHCFLFIILQILCNGDVCVNNRWSIWNKNKKTTRCAIIFYLTKCK